MVDGYFHAAATLSLDNHWKYVGHWIGSRIGLNTCRRDEFLVRAGNRTEMCPTMYLCASYGYLNKKWVGLLLQTSLTGFSLQLRALMKPGGGHSCDLSSKKLLLLMKIPHNLLYKAGLTERPFIYCTYAPLRILFLILSLVKIGILLNTYTWYRPRHCAQEKTRPLWPDSLLN